MQSDSHVPPLKVQHQISPIYTCRYVSNINKGNARDELQYIELSGEDNKDPDPDSSQDNEDDTDCDDEDTNFTSYISDLIETIEETAVGQLESKCVDSLSEILFGDIQDIPDNESKGLLVLRGNGVFEELDEETGMELAEWFVWRLFDEKEEGNSSVHLPIEVYNMIIQKYLLSEIPDGFEKAKTVLNKMVQLYQSTHDSNIRPNYRTFNLILSYMAKPRISKQRETDEEATQLFEIAENIYPPSNSNRNGMIESKIHLIDIVAQSRNKGSSYQAENLLRELMDSVLIHPIKVDTKMLTTRIFNVVLTSIAKTNEDVSPERASELLAWMSELSNTYTNIKPNVYSFTAVLDAFAQRNQYDYSRRAEGIWSQMLSFYLSGESDIEPDVFCATIVISSYARLAKKGSRDAARKAEKILKRMEDLYKDGKTTVKPDAVTYFTVLNAWAHTKQEDAAENAQQILLKMEHLQRDGDESMSPSHLTYRMVMEAWSKNRSPEAIENAEIIFERIKDIYLKEDDCPIDELKQDYRIMISGWVQKKKPRKAENYLKELVELGVCPDPYCFDKVIDCWSQSDDGNVLAKATCIFSLAENLIESGELSPTERLFTSFIRVIAKSDVKEKASKAQAILYRMMELDKQETINDIKPSIFSYNAVLFACCNTVALPDHPEAKKAFEIAIITFNELRNAGMTPDHITYGSLLKAASLLQEGDKRDKTIIATFKKCIQDGYLNDFVLGELKLAASPKMLTKLIGTSDVEIGEFPYEWCRNGVKKRKQNGKQRRK